MKEYHLEYLVKFIVNGKNLETIEEVRSLGSTITSMEFCMLLDDRLKELKFNYENIKKVSYNYNRENKIIVEQNLFSEKSLSKDKLNKIRSEFIDVANTYYSNNKFHTFNNKQIYELIENREIQKMVHKINNSGKLSQFTTLEIQNILNDTKCFDKFNKILFVSQ